MKNLDTEFCRNVKSARREAGLTQSALAAEIGCKQSALSMFEQGDGTKLSDAVIEKLAKKFNLSVGSQNSKAVGEGNRQLSALNFKPYSRGFCPNPSDEISGCPVPRPVTLISKVETAVPSLLCGSSPPRRPTKGVTS